MLKEKFDDIFAATEYTKALDAIRTYKTEKAKDIKLLASQVVQHLERPFALHGCAFCLAQSFHCPYGSLSRVSCRQAFAARDAAGKAGYGDALAQ